MFSYLSFDHNGKPFNPIRKKNDVPDAGWIIYQVKDTII